MSISKHKTPEQEYQEYMGDVITKGAVRDYRATQGIDSYRRPDPQSPRFSEDADRQRQLRQQHKVDKSGSLRRLLERY